MQLLISTVGAAVGFAIGGPAGAQVGWAAGSLIGGALGPTQQGPRLSDTTVQVSSFGVPPGIVWGRTRKAGNVIWSTPLKEKKKSGNSKKGEPTTYSYSVSCAVGICEGVQGGIRRIWADSKLVFDGREEASAKAKAASSAFRKYFKFYPGDETQMPDPTIEAKEGVGNVPGYRGLCYVVFTDLPLARYGNRIPSFSFELSGEQEQPSQLEHISGPRLGPWTDSGNGPFHAAGLTEYTVLGVDGVATLTTTDFSAAIGELASRAPLHGLYIGYYTNVSEIISIFGYETALNFDNGAVYAYLCFNQTLPDIVVADGIVSPGHPEACRQLAFVSAVPTQPTTYMFSSYGGGRGGLLRLVEAGVFPPGYEIANHCSNYPPSVSGYYPTAMHSPNAVIRAKRLPTYPLKMCLPGIPTPDVPAELPGDSLTCVFFDGSIAPQVNFSMETGSFLTLRAYGEADGFVSRLPLGPTIRASDPRATDAAFWNAAADAVGIAERYNPPSLPQPASEAAVGPSQQTTVPEGSVLLSKIVRDICLLAGLRADQVDVSQLTEIVAGYQVSRESSARAAIEQLRQAFWFDAVESGELIRFVKRGGAPVAHLTFDDLGAGEEMSVEPVEPTRMQETELPASLSVVYAAGGADYQTGTQTSRRMATVSQQKTTLQLAITMDDQQAADAAAVLMYDAWTSRTERSISVLRSWSHLEPTDVITLHDGEFACTVRIVDKSEAGPVVKLLTRDDDAASYSPLAHAAPTPGGGSTVRLDGPTRLEVLDIPLLRQVDDSYGAYAAAAGYLEDWRGAVLYRTPPGGGVSPSAVGSFDLPASMGYARSILGTFDGGNVVDEGNFVDVLLHPSSDQIDSITYDELLNNGNMAVLGDEILQFRTATLLAPRTYRLTGLLRGRLGTEQHMAAHVINERFVLLDSEALLRVGDTIATRGAEQAYRAVTIGLGIDDAYDQPAVNTGASQKPLSPVHLRAARLPDGTYRAEWVRRTRYGGAWSNGGDVPLAEAAELYLVTVSDGSTVLEQKTVGEAVAILDGGAVSSLNPGLQLAYGVSNVRSLGGALFGGTSLLETAANQNKRLLKMSPTTGVVTVTGDIIGTAIIQVEVSSTQVFALYYTTTYFLGAFDPSTLSLDSVCDFNAEAIARGRDIAWLEPDLWCVGQDGVLRKFDATLNLIDEFDIGAGDPLIAIEAAGSDLLICVESASSPRVLRFSTVSETVTATYAVGAVPTRALIASGTLFVVERWSGGLAGVDRVAAFDASTGVLLVRHDVVTSNTGLDGDQLAVVGGAVLYVRAGTAWLFDAATGAVRLQYPLLANAPWLAGVADGQVYMTFKDPSDTGTVVDVGFTYRNLTFAYGDAPEPPNYSGKTLTVQQVSDIVGPGFPASITL